jgi:predicted RNA binding protein YcfA (HicA-like mRNA interferase family)
VGSPERCEREFERIRAKRCRNVRFDELCSLLEMHGWVLDRIARNNHYIFVHRDYLGIVSIPRPHRGHVKLPYCKHALQAIEEVAGYE